MQKDIGDIGNYYGGLVVKTENGKFFWSITDWNGDRWKEIPENLFSALIEYEKSRAEGA
jgi:hypothetical protein